MTKQIKERLEYLRQELRAERISYGEINELVGLAEYIEADDVELLEAAGVPEFEKKMTNSMIIEEIEAYIALNGVSSDYGDNINDVIALDIICEQIANGYDVNMTVENRLIVKAAIDGYIAGLGVEE